MGESWAEILAIATDSQLEDLRTALVAEQNRRSDEWLRLHVLDILARPGDKDDELD